MKRDWKRVERKIAEILGGVRVPVTGRNRGDVPDIEHEWLSPEIKTHKKLPDWLKDAHAQAVAASKDRGKLPIVVLHEKGTRYTESYVQIQLSDFVDWFVGPTRSGCHMKDTKGGNHE